MTYQKCINCGSEEFTADVIYNTTVKLPVGGDFEQEGESEARELDLPSVQCLNCGGTLHLADPELYKP